MKTKGIGTEYRRKLAKVITSENDIITPHLVSEILNISLQEAGRILSRWHHQCWVKRLKRGVYIPIAATDADGELSIEDPWILANNLFSPGYIAGFSAIKHWDFTDQIFETTTFFTTKQIKNRDSVIGNSHFHLKTILPYKVFGLKNVWRGNIKIAISDPTKTIIDLLDDPSVVGGMRIVKDIFVEYKGSEHYNLGTLVMYAEKMKNRTIFKRLGFLMETLGLKQDVKKYGLQNKISLGYSEFDPGLKNNIRISKWKLKTTSIWKKSND
jgi:predicted transcriptional regulator of viral defense system